MLCKTDRLVRLIRVKMGMSANAHQLIYAPGELVTLDDMLRRQIVPSVEAVHLEADAADLADVTADMRDEDVYWDYESPGHCYGHIHVPHNYMRLVTLRMSDWRMPVTSLTAAGTLEHRLAYSGIHHLQGTPCNPRAMMAQSAQGRRIDFRSCRSATATIAEALYIPRPVIDPYGGINIASRCIDRVIQHIIDNHKHQPI